MADDLRHYYTFEGSCCGTCRLPRTTPVTGCDEHDALASATAILVRNAAALDDSLPEAAVRDSELESLRERAETAERRLARVAALHQVHHCEDGHLLSRTPVPCENDGYCSCGQPGDRCPTRAALSCLPPETPAQPQEET